MSDRRRQRSDAKRMTGRIDEHVPARVALRLQQRCAEPNRARRGCFQVRCGGQVEVDDRGTRPFRRGVRRHSLGDQDDVGRTDADAAGVGPHDFSVEKLLIERPKLAGISAIERDSSDEEGAHETKANDPSWVDRLTGSLAP